jgi:hypothetical protein
VIYIILGQSFFESNFILTFQVLTPFHSIAYMLWKTDTDPELPHENLELARKFFGELNPSLFVYLIGYEIEDTTFFSESIFKTHIRLIQ